MSLGQVSFMKIRKAQVHMSLAQVPIECENFPISQKSTCTGRDTLDLKDLPGKPKRREPFLSQVYCSDRIRHVPEWLEICHLQFSSCFIALRTFQ